LLLIGCGGSAPTPPPPGDTCTLTPPTLADHRLRAEGTTLRDALGRVVVLRGVNAGGHSKLPPYAPFDFTASGYDAALAAYLDRAAAWGINALRVPFTWAAVEPTQGAYDDAFLMRYEALLDAAWARGMYTIVDFHQDVYADIYCGDGFPAWTVPGPHPAPHHDCPSWGAEYLGDADVQAAFDAFWASGSPVRASYDTLWDMMAAREADRPGVIGFEPFNEPAWGTADAATWEATTLTSFYADIAARLHAKAPGALVFFDTTGTDAVTVSTSLKRPMGDGLVFAPHYYQYAALGGTMPNPDNVQLSLQAWSSRGTAWGVPVLVGEFGVSNQSPDTAAYVSAHFDAFDALGLSGTAWEYSVSAELWNSEDLSVVRADGMENPSAAALVRPYARAVAGDGVAFSYDAASGAVTMSYTPAAGITEITLPARAYPAGYDVHVTGGCADASRPGRLLLQANDGAASVEVHVTRK
jgi:endoglycosylceramidase